MNNVKCFITRVITGANGIVTKRLKKFWKEYQESIQQVPFVNSCTRDIAHNKESATM
jgi:hypothetical protein